MNYPLAVVVSVAIIGLVTVSCKLIEEYYNNARNEAYNTIRNLRIELDSYKAVRDLDKYETRK